MEKLQIVNALKKNIGNYTHIEREPIDEYSIDCLPLAVGKQLVLIQYIYDFTFDGYKVLSLQDISNIKRSKVEKFFEKLIKDEGIYKQMTMPDLTCFDDWKGLIDELSKQNKNITIECENLEDRKFYLGKVVEIRDKCIKFLTFDALCVWKKRANIINYKDITTITFDNMYSTILSRYVTQTIPK